MFVDNRLGAPVRLARAQMGDFAVASLNVIGRYALRRGQLELVTWAADGALASVLAHPLWSGTSVCASGSVPGPLSPPFQTEVCLRVQAPDERREIRMVVSGDRRWRRRDGRLLPTPAERFDTLPMILGRAFGGFVDVPPGPAPGSGLPHPGMRFAFPLNPDGVGFSIEEEAAVDAPLPNFEWHDERMGAWDDRPNPACLAPCPDHAGLRLEATGVTQETIRSQAVPLAQRAVHPGHGRCIFGELLPSARIELRGLSLTTEFALPAASFSATVRRRGKDQRIRPRLRAVLVDDERDRVDLVWGAAFSWPVGTLPGELRVE